MVGCEKQTCFNSEPLDSKKKGAFTAFWGYKTENLPCLCLNGGTDLVFLKKTSAVSQLKKHSICVDFGVSHNLKVFLGNVFVAWPLGACSVRACVCGWVGGRAQCWLAEEMTTSCWLTQFEMPTIVSNRQWQFKNKDTQIAVKTHRSFNPEGYLECQLNKSRLDFLREKMVLTNWFQLF